SLAMSRNVLGGPKRDGSGAFDTDRDRMESFNATVPPALSRSAAMVARRLISTAGVDVESCRETAPVARVPIEAPGASVPPGAMLTEPPIVHVPPSVAALLTMILPAPVALPVVLFAKRVPPVTVVAAA